MSTKKKKVFHVKWKVLLHSKPGPSFQMQEKTMKIAVSYSQKWSEVSASPFLLRTRA